MAHPRARGRDGSLLRERENPKERRSTTVSPCHTCFWFRGWLSAVNPGAPRLILLGSLAPLPASPLFSLPARWEGRGDPAEVVYTGPARLPGPPCCWGCPATRRAHPLLVPSPIPPSGVTGTPWPSAGPHVVAGAAPLQSRGCRRWAWPRGAPACCGSRTGTPLGPGRRPHLSTEPAPAPAPLGTASLSVTAVGTSLLLCLVGAHGLSALAPSRGDGALVTAFSIMCR